MLFEAQNVEFRSRTTQIIKGISLSIEKGTVAGFTGRSGSGKSTLLKLIAGIYVPTGGKVFYSGTDIQAMTNAQNLEFRRKCSFVFQDSALLANQDILQNLSLPLTTHFPKMKQNERLERIKEVCSLVNFDRPLNLRPVDLSMGEQKKVAFARALINKPECLFLDECTESLDRRGGSVIMGILKEFIKNGNTVIYVSHSSSFITEIGGKLFAVDEGKLSE